MDVEGFETQVVAGGLNTFRNPNLVAVLMELNGSGQRYGFDEERLHARMLELGFSTFRYDPPSRTLDSLKAGHMLAGNTLYVRDVEQLRKRVASAPVHKVQGAVL
jgi:hypothetical protein